MKRIALAILLFFGLFFIVTIEQYLMMPSVARAQTNTFCAANLACTVTGIWTFSTPPVISNINNTLYISQFAGAELGAKMVAAVTNCTVTLGLTACKYVIDIGGTISTAPNFPIGSTVECTATGLITLTTTWAIMHRSTVYYFNGCQFNYTADASAAAFKVGKNSTGTVNTSGTTITFATGTNFANMDVGDQIDINGVGYNVCTVTPPNTLTTCATAGSQSGVAYGAKLLPPNVGSNLGGIVIRGLNVSYGGAGTTTSDCIFVEKAFDVQLENPHCSNFTGNQSVGILAQGAIDLLIYRPVLTNNKCQAIFDQSTIGGVNVGSNQDKMILPLMQTGGACASTAAININNGSFGLDIDTGDFEGNASTYAILVQNGSYAVRVRNGDFEVNGDGTASSYDILFNSGGGNIAENNHFTSLLTNRPQGGILCGNSGTFCTLENNVWDATNNHYGTAWNFISSGAGRIAGNDPKGVAHGDPANTQDVAGNYTVRTVNSTVSTGTQPYFAASTTPVPNLTVQNLSAIAGGLLPSAAAGANVGSTALPFGGICLGTAATNNLCTSVSAMAAARTLTVPDPLGNVTEPYVIVSGTSTLTTTSTATLTCQTTVTTAAVGALTTDAIELAYASAPTAATDGLMTIQKWVTAGNVNFMRCNPTAGTLVPTALVINWKVIR